VSYSGDWGFCRGFRCCRAARGSVEGSGRLVSLTWLASLDGL